MTDPAGATPEPIRATAPMTPPFPPSAGPQRQAPLPVPMTPYPQAAPLGTTPMVVNTMVPVTVPAERSVGLAVLLALLFGPAGMFYSTVLGALVMLFVSVLPAILTVGISLFVTQPLCALWAGLAAADENKKRLASMRMGVVAAPVAPPYR